ncbi:putative parapinopsin b [Triplophysa rosa]|uniref:Parapinopsin b n=1 Tax=Triplophysa rosa TaxID=992332 RepID=A0A9W7TFI5_TRIRA|nr:putative parapinopsin b [Triplophysa rosa]
MASFPEVSNGSSVYGLGAKTPLPRAGFITLSVLMVLASVTSVVLNATVIAVTLRHKQLRQPLNFALVNLAVADLGTTFNGRSAIRGDQCRGLLHHGTGRLCVGGVLRITALCTVALIAAERLFVVCKPLGTITFQSRHAAGGLELCWLWSLIWNTPPLLGWGSYQLEGVGTSCGPDWQGRDLKNVSYIICYFSLCFAVPFALIVISYSWLLYTLRQVAKVGRGAAARAESKVAWMVVMMVLAFLVSWLPCAALALTVVFNPEVQMSALVKVVPIYMAKSSTVYNPMIYIFMNKQFQRYAVPLLTCGKDPWPSEDDASELQTVVSPVNKISPE